MYEEVSVNVCSGVEKYLTFTRVTKYNFTLCNKFISFYKFSVHT